MAAALQVTRASGLRWAGAFLVLVTLLHVYEQWRQDGTPPRIIVVAFKGRLGNQLFQVAAGEYFRRVAKGAGETVILYKRNSYSPETDLSESLFRPLPHFDEVDEACAGVPESRRTAINEIRHSCDLIKPTSLRGLCTVVDGFFQCPAYAEAGRDVVIALLRDAPEYVDATRKFRELVAKANTRPAVALHVRRGDYTKRFNRGLLEPLPKQYYTRAARLMPADAMFLVFSDDLKWCKKELPGVLEGVDEERIIFVDEKSGLTSLLMMMLADHNIIANSTFSWWAAFLNANRKKKVCAPKDWFGGRVKKRNMIYPATWIKV